MTFFDDLKDKASDAAVVAGKAMSEVYEATKLKMAISEKKGVLKTLYKEVGEIVYTSYKKGETAADDVEDKLSEIDAVVEEIEALKEQQRKIKKVKVCPGCGSQIPTDCNFCPKCGKETSPEEPEEEAPSVDAEIISEPEEEQKAD